MQLSRRANLHNKAAHLTCFCSDTGAITRQPVVFFVSNCTVNRTATSSDPGLLGLHKYSCLELLLPATAASDSSCVNTSCNVALVPLPPSSHGKTLDKLGTMLA
jgi:hypothetical protein